MVDSYVYIFPPFAHLHSLTVFLCYAPNRYDACKASHGLFKSIMQPAFFVGTLSVKSLKSGIREVALRLPFPQLNLRVDADTFGMLISVLSSLVPEPDPHQQGSTLAILVQIH